MLDFILNPATYLWFQLVTSLIGVGMVSGKIGEERGVYDHYYLAICIIYIIWLGAIIYHGGL